MIGATLRLTAAFAAVAAVLTAANYAIAIARDAPVMTAGVASVALVGYTALAAYRRLTRPRYGPTSVGVVRRFEREPATTTGHTCRACETPIEPGDRAERRRWWREAVVGGAVVWRSDAGEGYYCEDHAHKTVTDGLEPIPAKVTAPYAEEEAAPEGEA